MKYKITRILVLLFLGIPGFLPRIVLAQTVTLSPFSPVGCAGTTQVLNLPIQKTGTFTGNQFRAELSQPEPSYSFSPPAITGNAFPVAGSTGTVPFSIPGTTAFGRYKIRVVHVASGIASNEVDYTLTPPYTISISPDKVCAGDTVTYAINIGPAPYYTSLSLGNSTRRWYRNNQLVMGQTGSTLRLLPHQFRSGDVIRAELRTNAGCFGGAQASFVISQNDTLKGLRLDTLPNRRVCSGDSLNLFWANVLRTGTAAPGDYAIQLSDSLGSFSTPTNLRFTTISPIRVGIPQNIVAKPTHRYSIRVVLRSIIQIAPTACDFSNAIPLLIGGANTSLAVTSSADSICAGSVLTFTSQQAGLTNPVYTWTVNGSLAGSSPVLSSGTFQNGDTVRLSVSGTSVCGPRVLNLAPQVVRVLQVPAAPVVPDGSRCGPGSVRLAIQNPISGLEYRWFSVQGSLLGTGNTFVTSTLTGTTPYLVKGFNGLCEGPATTVQAIIGVEPAKPAIAGFVVLDTMLCAGEQISLDAPVGFDGYLWNTGATTPSITVASAGSYSVQLVRNGCMSPTSDTVTVGYRPALTVPSGQQQNTVCGAGNAIVRVTNPQPGYRYAWYDAPTGGNLLSSDDSVIVAVSATSVWVVAANGRCTSPPTQASVTTTALPARPTIISNIRQLCGGETARLSAPAGFATYRWNTGATTQQISTATPGSYTVIVGNGTCESETSAPFEVIGNSLTPAQITAPTTMRVNDQPITIGVSPAGGTWEGRGVDASGVFNPRVVGIGTYKLVYNQVQGRCERRDSVTILVEEGPLVFANIISPNGDGLNDDWDIPLADFYSGTTGKILNRWGVTVASLDSTNPRWLGYAAAGNNTNTRLPAGTYYYLVTYPDGRRFTGTIELAY